MFRKNMSAALLAILLALPALAQQWVKMTPSVSPPAGVLHGMAYDTGGSQVLLFGGLGVVQSASVSIGTWTWNGTTWLERYAPTPDTWRPWPAMAAFGNDVLMFGSSGGFPSDTWKWSSDAWTQVATTGAPPDAYMGGASVSAFGVNVLVFEMTEAKHHETWLWNGTWTKLATSETPGYAGPMMRGGSGMAYDSIRGRAVLFGGLLSGETGELVSNETWEWDGVKWTQIIPVHSPPARAFSTMAYDAAAGVAVMFGGAAPDSNTSALILGDTWTWDGTDWTQHVLTTSPDPRLWSAMAYDAARGNVVMYGGIQTIIGENLAPLGDTWIWEGPPYAASVQQPINAGGTSVFKARRGVIPVKFSLKKGGVQTCNLPPATIVVNRLSASGSSTVVNEGEYMQNADSGSNFRIDQCQYIYNLAASVLGVGTYRVDIVIDGKVAGSATFQVA